MRLLYEINADLDALLSQVDEETGELLFSVDDLEALQMERETALEGIALSVKNKLAEAAAIKAEIDTLTERKTTLEKKAARLKELLAEALAGDKLSTPRVAVSYRTSSAVELADDFFEWAIGNPDACAYLRYKNPEPDKKAITDALKAGQEIPGAELVKRQTMQIK